MKRAVSKPHTRVVELDILRAVAIIIIIFSHFNYFLPTAKYSQDLTAFTASFGVALFLFISGFVLYLNHPSFPQRNSFADFYKKRVLRIFPLYWLAIALSFVIRPQQATRIDAFVIVVLGLQGFFSPRFGTYVFINAWWFIGVIVVLYTIYPLITALASDARNLPAPMESSVFKFAIMLIVPFLILVAARITLSIVNSDVFVFYGIFVLGVAVSKYNVLGKYGFLTDNRTRLLKYVAVATVSLAAVLLIYTLLQPPANASAALIASYSYGVVLRNALFFLFTLLAFCLARIVVVSSSKASRPLSRAVWYRALLLIAFSSYAIYLFFTPILTQLMDALIGAQLTALEIDVIQIFVGLPTVVLVAYLLQSTQNEIVNRVRKYRTASAPPSDKT
jgi:peptidoglycan/LPS O-acetylase OafA/YrhL